MTTGAIDLELEPREVIGKKVRQLRRQGIIPVHLYGPGYDSRSMQCQTQRLVQALAAAGGSTPISITVKGERGTVLAFTREIQWNPRRDDLVHVDLLVVDSSRPVTAQVPIVLNGESPGAQMAGGTIGQLLWFLDVQALPLEMPAQVDIDLETLTEVDSAVRAGDLELPPGVDMLTDAEELIARVELPRVEEEEEEEEPEDGEETEDGEAAEEEPAE